jgi:transcriptional regulator with XRE-family HTH domain
MNGLAKATGLTQPTISILESSQPNPKLDSLLRIARALELNLGDVLKEAIRNVNQDNTESKAAASDGQRAKSKTRAAT